MSKAISIPNHNDLVSVKEKKEVIKSYKDAVYIDIQNLESVLYYLKDETLINSLVAKPFKSNWYAKSRSSK